MLSEIHEFLGLCALAAVGAAVAAGGAAYRYQAVKGFLPVKRPALVRVHLWAAIAFVAAATFHYLLAPRVHGLQQAGVLALVVAFLLGLSFRWSRKHFAVAVKAKIALVVLAALLLPVGHWLVGEDEHGRDHSGSVGGTIGAVAAVLPPPPTEAAATARR